MMANELKREESKLVSQEMDPPPRAITECNSSRVAIRFSFVFTKGLEPILCKSSEILME